MANCERCGTYMNPAEAMLGPYCGGCVRKAHASVVNPRSVHTLPSRGRIESTKAAQVPLGYAEGFREDLNKVAKKYGRRRV